MLVKLISPVELSIVAPTFPAPKEASGVGLLKLNPGSKGIGLGLEGGL